MGGGASALLPTPRTILSRITEEEVGPASPYGKVLALFSLVAASALFAPAASRAQLGMDKDPFGKVGQDGPPVEYGKGQGGGTFQAAKEEPYGGQIFCPVSGAKLGLQQPAVPVQTSIGEEKPSKVGKLLGQKAKPGVVIYACCPECAEKIRSNPPLYLTQVATDRSRFAFKYDYAPSARPEPAPINHDQNVFGQNQPAEAAGTSPDSAVHP
jgi:hypothetical protein